MQYKIKLAFFLLISASIFSDSIKYNNPNNHGVVGLINTPTARFFEESSSAFTVYRGDPDRKIILTMMPYDWFEASIFYTSIEGRTYPSYEWQDYKDKGFNAKFRLKKEGRFPALAIGFNDIGGTGIYSSEYIVGSYGTGNIDLHFGFGWGRLNGGQFQQDNPFSNLDESFLIRDDFIGQGGELRLEDFFSGEKVGLFGGFSYLFHNDWLFKLEHDSTNIPLNQGFPERNSDYNFSFEYIGKENFAIALNYERSDYLSFKFIWKGNSSKHISRPYSNNNPYETTPHERLRSLLDFNEIEVHEISKLGDSLILDLHEYNSYSSLSDLNSNLEKSINDSGVDYEEIIVSYGVHGLEAEESDSKISMRFDKNKTKTLYSRKKESRFFYSPDFVLRPFIAGREGFFKAAFFNILSLTRFCRYLAFAFLLSFFIK
mgnify:CR=1 FL=1